jgi:hypothetical protein
MGSNLSTVIVCAGIDEAERSSTASIIARLVAGGNEASIFGVEFDLNDADYFLLVWSKTLFSDAAIIYVARQALNNGKLIKFLSSGCDVSEIPVGFANYQIHKFTGASSPIMPEHLDKALAKRLSTGSAMFSLAGLAAPPGAAMGFMNLQDHPPPSLNYRAGSTKPKFNLSEAITLDGHYLSQNALYASGAGTLTQLNAIIIALDSGLFSQTMPAAIKATIVVALMLHILAAFMLCFALRPQSGAELPQQLLVDTISKYKAGWRTTLAAMAISAMALVWFVLLQAEAQQVLSIFFQSKSS